MVAPAIPENGVQKYDPVRPWSRNNSSINFSCDGAFLIVLLMFAEADNEINGPTQEGINAINRVRKRANATEITLTQAGNNRQPGKPAPVYF